MKTAICCIVKNENLYLRDWLLHYEDLKVDNVLLFDNNDIDGEYPLYVISDYIDKGFVLYHDIRGQKTQPGEIGLLYKTYNKAFNELYFNQYDWIMFFDIDEYLILKKHRYIYLYLLSDMFRDLDVVFVHWQLMSDSGNLFYENVPVMRRFQQKLDITSQQIKDGGGNCTIKAIVRANKGNTISYDYAHDPVIRDKNGSEESIKRCDNSGKDILIYGYGFTESPSYEYAELRHFLYLTIQEYLYKRIRYRLEAIKTMNYHSSNVNRFFDGKLLIFYHFNVPRMLINNFFYSLKGEKINEETPEKTKIILKFMDSDLEVKNACTTMTAVIVLDLIMTIDEMRDLLMSYVDNGFKFLIVICRLENYVNLKRIRDLKILQAMKIYKTDQEQLKDIPKIFESFYWQYCLLFDYMLFACSYDYFQSSGDIVNLVNTVYKWADMFYILDSIGLPRIMIRTNIGYSPTKRMNIVFLSTTKCIGMFDFQEKLPVIGYPKEFCIYRKNA